MASNRLINYSQTSLIERTWHWATEPSADLKTFKSLCVPSCSWTKPLSGGLGSLWWSHHLQTPASVCVCARTSPSHDLVHVFCRACRILRMCVWLAGSQNRLSKPQYFSPHTLTVVLYDPRTDRAVAWGWGTATAERRETERRRSGGWRGPCLLSGLGLSTQ